MFLYGIFGGWDDETLAEFRLATSMTGPLRGVVTWLMLNPTALGAKWSPAQQPLPHFHPYGSNGRGNEFDRGEGEVVNARMKDECGMMKKHTRRSGFSERRVYV